MPAIQLTPAQRKAHRADAHHLDPVVFVGADGLTDAVVKETNAALRAHGLIKVRVFSDDRFELDRLREYDAHFRFRGKAVRVDDVPMENVEMNIVLERGVLRYDPVKLGIADGTLTLVGTLDANGRTPRLDARLHFRRGQAGEQLDAFVHSGDRVHGEPAFL